MQPSGSLPPPGYEIDPATIFPCDEQARFQDRWKNYSGASLPTTWDIHRCTQQRRDPGPMAPETDLLVTLPANPRYDGVVQR